jgi:hypothetical protein
MFSEPLEKESLIMALLRGLLISLSLIWDSEMAGAEFAWAFSRLSPDITRSTVTPSYLFLSLLAVLFLALESFLI